MLDAFFYKVTNLRPVNLLKSDSSTCVFSCEIYEIFRNIYFEEHLRTTSPEETPLMEVIKI